MIVVGVALAGAAGAMTRFVLERALTERYGHGFPWGTLLVNVSGSLLAGLVTGWALTHALAEGPATVAGAGFLGGYTTFSTFAVEGVRLVERHSRTRAVGSVLGSPAAALAAAAAGLAGTGAL